MIAIDPRIRILPISHLLYISIQATHRAQEHRTVCHCAAT